MTAIWELPALRGLRALPDQGLFLAHEYSAMLTPIPLHGKIPVPDTEMIPRLLQALPRDACPSCYSLPKPILHLPTTP